METGAAVGRRHVLRRAGVAAGGVAVAGLGLATPAIADEDDELNGSWMVTANDAQETQLVASFAGGGVLISYAINPAGPPFIGTWSRQRDGGFRGELWAGYPGEGAPGKPGPIAQIIAHGHVEGRTIVGSYSITDYPSTGKPVVGEFKGERITP